MLDDAGLGIVVQRGERGNLVDLGEHLIVDERGILEVPATLNDAVAEGLHLEAMLVDELDDLEDGIAGIVEVHDLLDLLGLGIVVQRGERGNLVDLGEHLIVDERGILEVPATLNDAVAEGLHLEAMLVDELDDLEDGIAGIVEVHDLLDLLAITLDMAEDAVGQADTLAIALGEDRSWRAPHRRRARSPRSASHPERCGGRRPPSRSRAR